MNKRKVNSTRTPIYRDSGFDLFDAETTAEAFDNENLNERDPGLYIYSRFRNPTVVAAEEEIMKLEESEWALLTQSGMSAIDIALSVFQNGKKIRPWLFFSEIYGGTITFAELILKQKRGLDIHSFSPENGRYDSQQFGSLMQKLKPELVYLETVSNPMLIVPDVRNIIEICRKYGARIIVDNTFATPVLWKPLADGADIVIHSVTKYLAGHGNITAGVLSGNDKDIMKASVAYRKYSGHMFSADDAYRFTTQIQTLRLRFRQQCYNAAKIAEILNDSDSIDRVMYPGLQEHPSHREAKNLFGNRGYGGMVTFDLAGANPEEKRDRRDRFIKSVAGKIGIVPSLGDPGTIMLPVESVWGAKYKESGMIRLSVGYVDGDEIFDSVSNALRAIG